MSTKVTFDWWAIEQFDTMAQAKEYILNGEVKQDGEEGLLFKWHPKQPGDGKKRSYFLCKTHKECKFMARAIFVGNGFECQITNDVVHECAEPAPVRQGSGINVVQRQRIVELVDLGLTAGRIFNELSKAELERCKLLKKRPLKRVAGGYRGECSPPCLA
jgi:hypothetical protein